MTTKREEEEKEEEKEETTPRSFSGGSSSSSSEKEVRDFTCFLFSLSLLVLLFLFRKNGSKFLLF